MKITSPYPACLIILLLSSFLFFSGCDIFLNGGSESETDGETSGEDQSDTDDESDADTSNPLSGYDLALNSGSFWTFYWTYEDSSGWTSSYDSNSSSSESKGFVTITLGSSKDISGNTLYEANLYGDIPSRWDDEFWEYLGVDGNSVIGSKDGSSLETIINGSTGVNGTSFFCFFTTEQSITQSSSFSADTPVEYSTTADKSSFSTSYDESISLPEYGYFSSGDEGNYYNNEYYKRGIGPLGYYEYNYWREEDGTDSYWGRHTWSFNLTDTSLSASDGFEVPKAPWRIYGEMPDHRDEAEAVVANDVLYLLGGQTDSYDGNTNFHKESSSGTWTPLSSPPPSDWYRSAATVRDTGTSSGENIIFLADTGNPTIYSYSPTGIWSTIDSYSSSLDVYDCFMWGSDLLYMVLGHSVVGYEFSTGDFLDPIYLDSDLSYLSAITRGDYIYIVGQYLVSGGGIFNNEYIYSTRIIYYNGSSWSSLLSVGDSERRWCPGLAIYNDRLYVFGGTEDGTHVISSSIASGAPSDWQSHSPMLYGGTNLDAEVRGSEILVFGCDDGEKIEIYSPDND